MTFSIVVPMYNVREYLLNCLNSIKKQTYESFEVIIVDDGSTDDSLDIATRFIHDDNRFKIYSKENGGLSSARNYGIDKATGDYLVLVDTDDSINEDLLKNLKEEIEKNDPDIIKYRVKIINKDKESIYKSKLFNNIDGPKAILNLMDDDIFVTAWSTAYKMSFFKNQNFSYAEGRIHEDFGLTPIIYMNARKVSSIEYVGYNYYIRKNSIMTTNDPKRVEKKNEDYLFHYDNIIAYLDNVNNMEFKAIFKSYLANALLNRASDLNGKILDNYLSELKKRKVYKDLRSDTFMRRMKKIIININPKTYVKVFLKK